MSLYFFISAIVVIAIIAVLAFVKNPVSFFSTRGGRGVAFGIGAVLALAIAGALISHSADALEYFPTAELYVGLDHTRKISPMCEQGPNSDRLTSNVGVRSVVIRTDDRRASINAKYTHHSCAVNMDKFGYDAAGVEIVYLIF